MIGCLGGLGRSISRWMALRGAKNFVFLGRSGTDKPEAQALVEDLERNGGSVTVIRGDVSSFKDVERTIASARGPIGGVIQAAMGLDVRLSCAEPCGSIADSVIAGSFMDIHVMQKLAHSHTSQSQGHMEHSQCPACFSEGRCRFFRHDKFDLWYCRDR